MSTGYIKRLSDGRILCSNSSQDENNPAHLQALQNFVTSRGWSLSDYEIGFKTKAEVQDMIDNARTSLEQWINNMRGTDDIPRWMEDHIRDDHGGVAGNAQLQAKYDAKVALRNTKP